MAAARFRFHGELGDFLPRQWRGAEIEYACARAASLKNAIEALGVPHTEVGRALVGGAPATLDRTVREGDAVDVYPWSGDAAEAPGARDLFLADAHLGGLARFLRMLGFDTLHENAFEDAEIRRLASQERRVVLTRDRELLKCRDILAGCYVHERKPEAQLAEVAARYGLAERARPFTLCLRCNLPLAPVDKSSVAVRLPEAVARSHSTFMHCSGCDRVYWPGSHYDRMRAALGRMLGRS